MLVVSRFRVPEGERDAFEAQARRAIEVLALRPGYHWARLGQAADDPSLWVLASEWDGAGTWRRALGAYDVRVEVAPLLGTALDEPGAYVLVP